MITERTYRTLRRLDAKRVHMNRKADQQRIADLEAQVTRLQSAVRFAYNEGDELRGYNFSDAHILEALMLHPGDLDPVNGGDA